MVHYTILFSCSQSPKQTHGRGFGHPHWEVLFLKNLLELLDRTAARLPDAPAFCDEETSITWSGLKQKAAALGTASPGGKRVAERYEALLREVGTELDVLRLAPPEDIARAAGERYCKPCAEWIGACAMDSRQQTHFMVSKSGVQLHGRNGPMFTDYLRIAERYSILRHVRLSARLLGIFQLHRKSAVFGFRLSSQLRAARGRQRDRTIPQESGAILVGLLRGRTRTASP